MKTDFPLDGRRKEMREGGRKKRGRKGRKAGREGRRERKEKGQERERKVRKEGAVEEKKEKGTQNIQIDYFWSSWREHDKTLT